MTSLYHMNPAEPELGSHAWRNKVVCDAFDTATAESKGNRTKFGEIYTREINRAKAILEPTLAPLLAIGFAFHAWMI